MKMWKNELFQFILQIIFGSVFTIYQGTPILCCTTDTCKNHKITKMAKITKIATIAKIAKTAKIA